MRLSKINFARIFVLFILLGAVMLFLACAGLFSVFQSRIQVIMTVHSYIKRFEDGTIDISSETVNTMPDNFTDILLLDSHNKILLSQKNFPGKPQTKLELKKLNLGKRLYLTTEQQTGIYFKPIENNKKSQFLSILRDENTYEEYCADFFYQNTFNPKGLYYLSCAVSPSGQKLYFIWEATPVANGEFYLKCSFMLFALLFVGYWVLLALWIYSDAQKSRLHSVVWGLLVLFSNLAGAVLYLIYRLNQKTCFKCGTAQNPLHLYCRHCGTKIGICCEKCGSIQQENNTYCTNCGTKL